MTRFYNALAALAVILTPVAMMAAFGWTAYTAILAQTGVPALAALSGLATAAAVESIGIVAGETALWFHGRHDRRWAVAAAILALYVAFGLVVLRGTPLALLPVLAGAVYVLVGLRAQAQRESVDDAASVASQREWEREQWRIRQADKTRVRLTEVEVLAQSQHTAGRASTEPAESGHTCADCGRAFATVQALNAHRRHCTGAVLAVPVAERTNGKVTHE